MTSKESETLNHPECWSDDIRMDVLFSPFRLRKVNPENYDAKVKFWENMIERYCQSKGSPCFSIREVRWAFQRKEKLPHGIETVVESLRSRKALRMHSDYINDPQNTWSGWLVNRLVWKPIQWTMPTSQEADDVPYIHLDILKIQTKLLKKVLEQFAGSVISFDRVFKTDGHGLSKEGLFLNLLNLQTLEKVFLEFKAIDGQQRVHLINVPEKGSKARPITDADRAIYALEQTEEDLLKTLEEIEIEVVKYDKLARENVREGKRVVAKSYLRKKHKMQKVLEKHSKALENVQTLLGRIQETRGNELILDAYTIGSQTLKSLLNSSNMNIDSIDEVVDTIKESLDIHDEVEQSLSSVLPVDTSEEQALEEELQELLNDTSDNSKPETYDKPRTVEQPGHIPEVNTSSSTSANEISDSELLKHLDDLQIELGSLSTENVVDNQL